jgi:hypothetical protein
VVGKSEKQNNLKIYFTTYFNNKTYNKCFSNLHKQFTKPKHFKIVKKKNKLNQNKTNESLIYFLYHAWEEKKFNLLYF